MKIESVIEPNIEIQNLQEKLLSELSSLLPNSHIELVGAMAVPMIGRPEIDIMIISEDIENDSFKLVNEEYVQGPVEKGISYLKKMQDDIEVGIQIMSPDNNMINIHRNIILKLRENESLRNKYEEFKKTLSGLSRDEYKKQKSAWIRENLI
ncbi:MAG: GrpB family protein [Candidatus Pacebacteria bacterium]|nr:GrpB family protein [Candidatus Paceibacterota bacterium]